MAKTIEQRKQQAKERVHNLLTQHMTGEFIRKNYTGFSLTTKTYCILKSAFKDKVSNVSENEDFKKAFSQFYGIQRFVSDEFKQKYFKRMEGLKFENECDARELTEELKDTKKNKYQFSFVTKLLNIMNDAKYPIYDSFVVTAFNLNPYTDENKKLEGYVECYQIITDIYEELLPKHERIISEFRDIIGVSEQEASNMRILDIMVWKLGADIIEEKQLLKKQYDTERLS